MPPINVYRVHLNSNGIVPLALGNISAMVRHHHPELMEILRFETPFLADRKIVDDDAFIGRFTEPSLFLMSDYVWNLQAHTKLSQKLKSVNRDHIIIHGGPGIPYTSNEFLQTHEEVDFTVHGEGEGTALELLSRIVADKDYQKVKGISYRKDGEAIFTESRDRIPDLSIIPSPYLGGDLDSLFPGHYCAVVETNRGCPYKCAYCSWGFYLRRIIKHDLDQVLEELEWISRRQIPSLWIADANFGIIERDIEIAEHLCRMKERYGFPKNVITNFANNKRRSMEISRLLIGAKIATSLGVAMQTTDETTLKNIQRKPVESDYYLTLRNEYVKHQLPVMTHFIIGLPGSTYQSFKKDIEFALEEKMYPQVFPAIVLPNTRMNEKEYRETHGIVTEPFLSRDYGELWEVIVSTASFSRAEYRRINLFCSFIHFGVCYRALKYLVYLVATEKGLGQTDVLEYLLDIGCAEKEKSGKEGRFPLLGEIVKALNEKADEFFDRKICMVLRRNPRDLYLKLDSSDSWATFYQEIKEALQERYEVDEDLIDTAIRIQRSILPSISNTLEEQELAYDFKAYYFQDKKKGPLLSLKHFKTPILFTVKDPKGICQNIPLLETGMQMLLNNFELDSPLWRNE